MKRNEEERTPLLLKNAQSHGFESLFGSPSCQDQDSVYGSQSCHRPDKCHSSISCQGDKGSSCEGSASCQGDKGSSCEGSASCQGDKGSSCEGSASCSESGICSHEDGEEKCRDAVPSVVDEDAVLCHPQGRLTRVLALVLMSLVGFGSFFCFDNPGALQSQVETSLNITAVQFSGLYSWYSWPNVVLPVVGGQLIDRYLGVRLGTILFSSVLLVGQLILSLGAFLDRVRIMELGRLVFGLGGESLNMAINTYTVAWFKGSELNLVFGLQLSIARLGSTVNFLLLGPFFSFMKQYCTPVQAVGFSLLVSASFILISVVCSIILGWLDGKREKFLRNPEQASPDQSCSQYSRFPLSFWLLCVCTLSYYGSIFPFISFAQGFFKERYSFSTNQANFITGMVYLVSAVGSPIFGGLIDKTGRNISWIVLAVLGSVISHTLLMLPAGNISAPYNPAPYLAVLLLGLMYSVLSSALWSLAAIIVPDQQLATGYGIMQALQNLGTALITLGAGYIVDFYTPFYLELYFIACLTVSLASCTTLYIINRVQGGGLNSPAGSQT